MCDSTNLVQPNYSVRGGTSGQSWAATLEYRRGNFRQGSGRGLTIQEIRSLRGFCELNSYPFIATLRTCIAHMIAMISARLLCSADGSTHTESNKLYRKVKHRYRPNLSPRQRPKRAMTRQRSRRRQRRGEPHTEHGLGVPRPPFGFITCTLLLGLYTILLSPILYGV